MKIISKWIITKKNKVKCLYSIQITLNCIFELFEAKCREPLKFYHLYKINILVDLYIYIYTYNTSSYVRKEVDRKKEKYKTFSIKTIEVYRIAQIIQI